MNADEQEFSGLVKRHKGTIYSVCLMFADNQDEANDLMQEVLVRLWKGFGTFQGKGDEKGWVWRVAMNTCITQDAKKKHFTKVPVEENLLTSDTEDSKQMRMLHDRIHRLEPFDRAIVGGFILRGDRSDCGNIRKERLCPSGPHKGTVEKV